MSKDKKVQVSIIVPTYNRGYCIAETIYSVSRQTFEHYELLVVDDGSTDQTEKVVNNFPEVRYFRLPENLGVSHARNFGVSKSIGRYLCFLDSDDLWVPEKLQRQMDYMESQSGCNICYTDEVWVRNGIRVNPGKRHRKYSGDIFKHCLPLCIVSPSSAMIRAVVFKEKKIFDETMPACEDYDLWLRLSLHHSFHFIDEKLVIKKGGHPDQLSQKYWGMDRFRVYALEKLLRSDQLKGDNYKRTAETLIQKSRVLYQGFLKRNNRSRADYYHALMEKYKTDLSCLIST
ncbi:MAG: glycosyltransferase [Nitrospinota bacterium]|nr:glycosyltransferase [Nitrospinota bacterium]